MERLEYGGVKVKTFQNSTLSVLEIKINEFLDEVVGRILDIRCYYGDGKHNATILYEAQEIIDE